MPRDPGAVPDPTFVDNPFAPEFFSEGALGFFRLGDNRYQRGDGSIVTMRKP